VSVKSDKTRVTKSILYLKLRRSRSLPGDIIFIRKTSTEALVTPNYFDSMEQSKTGAHLATRSSVARRGYGLRAARLLINL
jgi:hypothetical protein